MRKPLRLLLALALLAGFTAGMLLEGYGDAETAADANPDLSLRAPFSLPDLEGRTRRIAEWDGDVVLLNFWAPWCPPCRREVPAFIQLQNTYGAQGLTIVGVTIDTPEKTREFVRKYGINYPVLVGEHEGTAVAGEYGNGIGALPYSVVIDREGFIRHSQGGELSLRDAEKMITPLL